MQSFLCHPFRNVQSFLPSIIPPNQSPSPIHKTLFCYWFCDQPTTLPLDCNLNKEIFSCQVADKKVVEHVSCAIDYNLIYNALGKDCCYGEGDPFPCRTRGELWGSLKACGSWWQWVLCFQSNGWWVVLKLGVWRACWVFDVLLHRGRERTWGTTLLSNLWCFHCYLVWCPFPASGLHAHWKRPSWNGFAAGANMLVRNQVCK